VSKLQCLDPRIADAVLDAARPARALSRDHLRHVEACESCRIAVERTRRLVSAYRDGIPSAAEIGAARVRYARHTARRHGYGAARRWHLLPRAVTIALLLAVVASAAAQIAARRVERSKETSEAAPAAKPPHHHRAHARHRLAGAPIAGSAVDLELDNGSDDGSDDLSDLAPGVEPAAAPAAATMPAPPPALPLLAPEPPRPAASVAAGAAAPAHLRKSPRLALAVAQPAPAETRHDPPTASWQAAAAALRANDRMQAELALAALAEAADPRTRDAARLARAQLWLSQGNVDRARADLQDLAASGVTSLIRQSARDALQTVP
jgi:hypothetical protein